MQLSTKILGHFAGGCAMFGFIGGIGALFNADYFMGITLVLWNTILMFYLQRTLNKHKQPKDTE